MRVSRKLKEKPRSNSGYGDHTCNFPRPGDLPSNEDVTEGGSIAVILISHGSLRNLREISKLGSGKPKKIDRNEHEKIALERFPVLRALRSGFLSFSKYNSNYSQKYATTQNDIRIRHDFMQFICHRKPPLNQLNYKIL